MFIGGKEWLGVRMMLFASAAHPPKAHECGITTFQPYVGQCNLRIVAILFLFFRVEPKNIVRGSGLL